ncbi:MAG: hypothetical protein LBS80_06600 [Tannerella sp.]|jgi:hypothetical protein|nr:hypothetical protein [Tannerella sp.]
MFLNQFQNSDGRFHIIEHSVPVDEQIEYFKFADRVKKDIILTDADYEKFGSQLNADDCSPQRKKKLIAILGAAKTVRAYRLLEDYAGHPDQELANWSYMALTESRIALETDLSDEKHVYISTGMGGKDDKLRFYVLIMSEKSMTFLDYQKEIINKEFNFMLPQSGCVVEKLTVSDKYVAMVFLIPMQANLKYVLEKVIAECNQYGDFLSRFLTVTNVKELNVDEISKIIESYERDYVNHPI